MREAGPTGDGRAQPWSREGELTGIKELGRQQEERGAILGTGGLVHQVLQGKTANSLVQPEGRRPAWAFQAACTLQGDAPARERLRVLN